MLSTLPMLRCVDNIVRVLYDKQGLFGMEGGQALNGRIKMIREALQMSQREFGEKLGVSRDVISNIEYDRVQPKELLVKHLCDLYSVNEQWIKTGEGEMFCAKAKLDKRADEALSIFQSLRPEFQDYALEQIRQLVLLQEKNKKQ